uniref:DDE Tnp4 domain-containing protein n=1 Tax=Amphimedon queenslandica TaxID=400682 RepID=A0A1X7VH05_AMPQE
MSLSFSFRISPTNVSRIVYETCEAIWFEIQPEYLAAPTSTAYWLKISKDAIDDKHINIQAPPNVGSAYYNYKGFHSIVLLAICDSEYRFILVDIGEAGRQSDGGVLLNSAFGQALETNSLFIPAPSPLPNDSNGQPLPYVIVGDEAFQLKSYMLRSYPGRFVPGK